MENQDFFQRVSLPGNPQARPECVIVRGKARFTVLTSRLLRLEWSPTGEFTDFATLAFPNRHAEDPPEFAVREDAEHLWIETSVTLAHLSPAQRRLHGRESRDITLQWATPGAPGGREIRMTGIWAARVARSTSPAALSR